MNLSVLQYKYRPPHVYTSLVSYHPYRQHNGNERCYVSALVSFILGYCGICAQFDLWRAVLEYQEADRESCVMRSFATSNI